MSKNACELVKFVCPNEGCNHTPFSKENPNLLITGEIALLPRLYKTDSDTSPRDFGLKIPLNCCTECLESINLPSFIRDAASNEEYKGYLTLGKEYIKNKGLPIANREVFCNNANHSFYHSDDNMSKTHDIIGRALFVIQPLEYLAYVDYNVYGGTGKPMNAYTFELEVDFCLHCVDKTFIAVREHRLNKLIARFQKEDSPDPRNDPDFAATFNYFQTLTTGG